MIVFDIETTGLAETDIITVSVAYSTKTEQFHRYTRDRLTNLAKAIKADGLVGGFNINHFDLPRLERATGVNLGGVRVVDPMLWWVKRAGHRISLNNLAAMYQWPEGFGQKTAHGSDAPKMWAEGRVDELMAYCYEDVRLECAVINAVYEHGLMVNGVHHRVDESDVVVYKSVLDVPVVPVVAGQRITFHYDGGTVPGTREGQVQEVGDGYIKILETSTQIVKTYKRALISQVKSEEVMA